jgi:hypothetical protein
MHSCLGVILFCATVLSAQGQTPSSKYQPGTIMAVTARQSPGQHDTNVTQYDVSLKVGKTTYVVFRHAAQRLALADAQQAEIRPLLEQEAGKVGAALRQPRAFPRGQAEPR